MSYQPMYSPPHFDPFEKRSSTYSFSTYNTYNAVPTNQAAQQRGAKPTSPVVRLWKEQLLAIIAGSLTLTLGLFGLLAFFRIGFLYTTFVPQAVYRGVIFNAANIGVLVAAVATILSTIGRKVMSGVARAWVRRRAVRGDAVVVRQWKTLAAGISIHDVRRTPFLAGGLTLAFTLAIAIQGTALAGVAIPSPVTYSTDSFYRNVVPLIGNAGQGRQLFCLSKGSRCAQVQFLRDIAAAFGIGLRLPATNLLPYMVNFGSVLPEQNFMGGMLPSILTNASDTSTYVNTPVSKFKSTCQPITSRGTVDGQYYYDSHCDGFGRMKFGDKKESKGSYVQGSVCASPFQINSTLIEIGMGGYTYANVSTDTLAYKCEVFGSEGVGFAQYDYTTQETTIGATPNTQIQPLNSTETLLLASGIIAAIYQERGMDGVAGPLQRDLLEAMKSLNPSLQVERGISNAMAASASAAYLVMQQSPPFLYSNPPLTFVKTISTDGFGWAPRARLLTWSIICTLIGLTWLSLALYMVGGGTRYNPTDWYQTLNTSAGSNLQQVPGTCTGAHLAPSKVNGHKLWYGELYPGHIGFAHQATNKIQPKGSYGDVKMGPPV